MIEQYFYGMLTGNGKITETMTNNVRSMIGQQGIEYLRALKTENSNRYIWFPQGIVAYPVVIEVKDTRKGKGGRTWVQNHTQLMTIHDYLSVTVDNVFPAHVIREQKEAPLLAPINV